MNPTEQNNGAATITPEIQSILDQAVERTIQQMESSHPYGLGKYTDDDAAALGIDSLGSLRLANQLVKAWMGSPMIPAWISGAPNPAGTFVACVLRGKELNFKMLESLNSMYMSPDGRLGLYGTAMLSLMRKSGMSLQFTILMDEGKEVGMEVYGKRKDGDEYTSRFTLADAMRANLGRVHKVYPIWMCKWRAVSDLFRTLASDLFGGPLYTAEELQEDEKVMGREVIRENIEKSENPYMAGMPSGQQDHHEPSSTAAAQGVGGGAESPNSPPAVESAAAQPAVEVGRDIGPASTGGRGNPTSPAAPKSNGTPAKPFGGEAGTGAGNGGPQPQGGQAVAPEPSSSGAPFDADKPESEDDTATEKNKSTFKFMLEAFAEQKKRLGADLYKSLLWEHAGIEHSNLFKSLAKAREVYSVLHNYELKPQAERKAADPNNPVERVKAALEELTGLYDKKSPDAVKKAVDGFMKGFYGPTKPKPDPANVEGILSVVRLARAILVQYPQQIVESAAKAQATGNTVGVGYRESLKYLEGRSPAVHAAFWRCAEALWCESGGQDGIEYLEGVLGAKTLADDDLAALLIITLRRPQTPAKALLNQSKVTGLPVSKIVAGWGIDLEKAPVEGINAFLKAAAAAKAEVVEPELVLANVNDAAQAAEVAEEDDGSWLLEDK